ncbi:MAG: hypothetical protein P8P83_06070, partial [Rickettsiaceae bacterium]|nr:hypothetical protein [Rickettsiaceae bacterium]
MISNQFMDRCVKRLRETKKRLGFTVSAPGDNTAKLNILNDALISPKLKEIAVLKNDIKINEAKLSDIYTRKSWLSLNSAEQKLEKKLKQNVIKDKKGVTKKESDLQKYRKDLGISVSKTPSQAAESTTPPAADDKKTLAAQKKAELNVNNSRVRLNEKKEDLFLDEIKKGLNELDNNNNNN